MNAFDFLTPNRIHKPGSGITMMLDKGIGPLYLKDILDIAGHYVDLAKFGWGTSALHDREVIHEKIESYISYDITPYPGGTLFEIAYLQNKLEEFLDEADKLGFGAIEISDGTIDISPGDREDVIAKVNGNGFLAITEVGKKDPKKDHLISVSDRIKIINQDLRFGADLVLIEAREGGVNCGIYDKKGYVKEEELEKIQKNVELERIIWEAPQKNQQAYLILKFGANVNLGNIPSEEITALETMRRGLRGDTLGKVRL
jgi:phosphosulfolactate synthase